MAEPDDTLVIGDKNYSSWSLRPWLTMKQFGIPFAEERVRLRQPDSKATILRHSAAWALAEGCQGAGGCPLGLG